MNICERLVVMSDAEVIDVDDLPQDVVRGVEIVRGLSMNQWPDTMSMAQIMESVEKSILSEARKRHRKQEDIAAALGMSQPSVARKLQKYGIGMEQGNG